MDCSKPDSESERIPNVKKYLIILAAVFVLAGNSANAAMEDLSITVGAVTWFNRFVPISRVSGMDVPKSSYAFMNGPTLKVQYKDLYFGATYLLSADNYSLMSLSIRSANVDSSASRSDVDLVAGYMLTPHFSLEVGYKGIFVDDAVTLASPTGTANASRTQMFNMGSLGGGATVPVGDEITLSVTANALLGSFHNEVAYPAGYKRLNEPADVTIAWGGSAEAKAAYSIIKDLSATLGVKAQYIKSGSDNSNIFGPTAGLEYRF